MASLLSSKKGGSSEAMLSVGASNPAVYLKSMLEQYTLPEDDLNLSDFDVDLDMHNHRDQAHGTPKSGHHREDPPTPTLSLPDSFDDGAGEYEGGGEGSGGKKGSSSRGLGESVMNEMRRLRAENGRLSHVLQDRQGMFRDLSISEGLYNELRLRPESDLSTHELACLRAHEFSMAPRKELEKTRRVLQETQSALQQVTTRAEEVEAQLARQAKMTVQSEDSLRIEMSALEERLSRAHLRLKEETLARQEGEEKASQFDRQAENLARVQRELINLQAAHAQQSQTLLAITQSEATAKAAERDSERARELLVMDKTHLTQELRAAEARADHHTKLSEQANSKALALEIKASQLADTLLNQQLTSRTGFDERMDREIQRLREDNQRELDTLRTTAREMADRENRVLREAKASTDSENEMMRRQVDSLSSENMRLQTQLAAIQGNKEGELCEQRAELKLKTFELASLGASYEQKTSQLRQVELELETIKGELLAHKTAFVRLEADSELKLQALNAQLKAATSRLAAYEALEEEIDGAVLRVAQANQSAGAGGREGAEEAEQHASQFLMSIKNVPSHPERRARQAVLLAQRLLETEGQREALKKELLAVKKSLHEAVANADGAKEALARTAQPTVYLVTKLRDEETARAQASAKCQALELLLTQNEEKKRNMEQECSNLRDRLKGLLQQRGEIDQLRGMLEAWQDPPEDEGEGDEEAKAVDDKPNSRGGGAGNAPPPTSSTPTSHLPDWRGGYFDDEGDVASLPVTKHPSSIKSSAQSAQVEAPTSSSGGGGGSGGVFESPNSVVTSPAPASAEAEVESASKGVPSPQLLERMVSPPPSSSSGGGGGGGDSSSGKKTWHKREALE